MGLHRSTTCPSSESDDSIINTLLHTLEDKAKASRLSEASMGLHRSTTCPSLNSDDPILNTLLHTLEDKAKAIAMERADAAIV